MVNGKTLGSKLYELRKQSGLSQEALAEKLDVSRQAVSKWECGESLPDTDNLITISKLYGVSLDELVGNTPEKQPVILNIDGTETNKEDADDDFDQDSPEEEMEKPCSYSIRYQLPYPILITAIFLLWGILWDGWAIAWTLYLTIPICYSLPVCIKAKRWSPFPFPVFATFVYCFIGMQWGIWHPTWIIYILIPVYYWIAEAIDRRAKKN
jgi:transcriptional regulator with XRE-family HTH domain